MAARNYSSVARLATLTAGINNSTTAIAVDQVTGFPTIPFSAVIDPGRAAEEIVTVTSVVGLNLTVIRGEDGTAAQPHDAAAQVRHMATARDFRESAEHVSATSGVHGATGELVDTASTQTLDNKTFTPSTTDHAALKVQAASGQTSDLLGIISSGSLRLGGIKPSGRVEVPGVDGTSSSTLTAGSAATVPLIVKGATSQSANLLSARNDVNTEVASISANGTLNGSIVNGGTINATASVNAPNINGSQQAIMSTTSVGTTPLIADNPIGQTAPGFLVRDGADATRAGVTGETGGYQLFHGTTTNLVPFKIHGGTQSVVMETGASSWGGTINIAAYGFTVPPIVCLTVRQENLSSVLRRVYVNIEEAPTATAIGFRVVQSMDVNTASNITYIVHWMAFQMLPNAAAG